MPDRDPDLWPFELKIGTPVVPALGNGHYGHNNFVTTPFYARQQELL